MKQINSFSRVVYSLLAVLFLASAPLVLAQMSGPKVTNFPRTAIGSSSAVQTILLTRRKFANDPMHQKQRRHSR
jgi:hypothetical protein